MSNFLGRSACSKRVLSAFIILLLTVLISGTSVELTQAQSALKAYDFDADPIQQDDALPVELVEERAPKAAAAEAPVPEEPSFDLAAKSPEVPAGTSDEINTLLNAKDVEITALIKALSKITKRDYIVDSSVKGKVTIHLPTAVTIPEALRILDSVLLLKGFSTVPVSDNIWKVVPAKDARQTTIPVYVDGSGHRTDALVTQLLRLKYVQASDIQQTLAQFVSKEGLLTSFTGTNALIMIDSAANIERLSQLVRQLDVPAVDQDITIIPMQYAEAKDVAEKINQILGKEGEDKSGGGGNIPRPSVRPVNVVQPGMPGQEGAANVPAAGGKRTLPAKVIADERTNSIIVVADPETTARIRAISEQLDSKVDLSGGKFYVYRLQHADSEELADVLNALISGGEVTSSSQRRSQGSSLTRGTRDRDTSGMGGGYGSYGGTSRSRGFGSDRSSRSMLGRDGTTAAREGGGPNVIGGSGGKVNFEGEVSIAPDAATNSLIINASRSDYLKLKEVIDQLDVKRKQVLVEATILEVSLNKDEGMGIELQGTAATDEAGVVAQTSFGGLSNLLTNPARLTDLTIAAASTGSLTLPGGLTIPSQALLISAVSSNQNVNVLSAPTILTTDNQEAEIIVGENVPFVTSTSTSDVNLNNTFNQIERQDVGITLRITPQIGFGQFVTLRIFVEISNVVPTTRNDPNGPTTSIRTTETNVEVKSGQMIATGGLISDSVTDSMRGVPYWSDLPVLGNLFRRDDETRRRTNLLVFITPRIVNDQYDARETTIERRDKMKRTIIQQEAEPNRAEVLNSESIDRVFEQVPSTMVKPSTITPSRSLSSEEQAAVQRTQRALEKLSEPKSESAPEPAPASDDVLDLHITPKLPGESAARRSEAPKVFVVLRQISAPSGSSDNLPPVDSSGTVGLILRGSAGQPGQTFFETGGRYTYRTGSAEQRFVCLGRYKSASEAAAVSPALKEEGSWREISPAELLTLGEGAWKRG